MLEHYGEFITVWNKNKISNSLVKYDYTPYEFGRNKQGYLVSISTDNDTLNANYVVDISKLDNEGKKWLSKCKSAYLTYKHVERIVQNIYFGSDTAPSSTLSVNNVVIDKTIRKMPNEEVRDFLAQKENTISGKSFLF